LPCVAEIILPKYQLPRLSLDFARLDELVGSKFAYMFFEQDNPDTLKFPDIVHFGSRPQQLCYAGSVEYQKTLREYVKYRHLLANMAKPSYKVSPI